MLRDSRVEFLRLIFPEAESLGRCRRMSFGERQAGRKQSHLATVEWRPDCQRGCGLSRYAELRLFCLEFPLCLKPVTDVVAWVFASFEVDFVGSESHVIFRNGRSL